MATGQLITRGFSIGNAQRVLLRGFFSSVIDRLTASKVFLEPDLMATITTPPELVASAVASSPELTSAGITGTRELDAGIKIL